MSWGRLDDQALTNGKLVALSDAAFRMWVGGIIYCGNQLTDGFILAAAIHTFGVRGRNKQAIAEELCKPQLPGRAALWSRVTGGYQVHDYLDWNEARADILERRKRDAQRKGFRGDSGRNPPGTDMESARSDPYPSEEYTHTPRASEVLPVDARQTPMMPTGAHKAHASCGRRCVPADLHDSFVRLSAKPEDEADQELRAWYPTVLAQYAGKDLPGGDDYRFWRAEYDTAHPAAPKKSARGQQDWEATKATFVAGGKS